LRVKSLGFGVRVKGLGFRVEGLGVSAFVQLESLRQLDGVVTFAHAAVAFAALAAVLFCSVVVVVVVLVFIVASPESDVACADGSGEVQSGHPGVVARHGVGVAVGGYVPLAVRRSVA